MHRLASTSSILRWAAVDCWHGIAGESKDQVAVNAIMGQVDNSMAAVYRERISDERLRAVVDCVHDWLFAQPADSADAA